MKKKKEEEFKEEEFYVCPHHQGTGGYESCCPCGDWDEGEPQRLCTENPLSESDYDND